MDFVCDFEVNSPRLQVRRISTFTDMASPTTQQSTDMFLFFSIFKLTTCKLILSHFGSKFQ